MYKIDSLTRIPLMSLFATCPLYFGRRGPCNMSFLLWKKKTRAALQPRKMHACCMAWTGCGGTLTWRVERVVVVSLSLADLKHDALLCARLATTATTAFTTAYICFITCVHACVCLPIDRSMRRWRAADRGTVDGWIDRDNNVQQWHATVSIWITGVVGWYVVSSNGRQI